MGKRKGVFPQSGELKDVVESHDWLLYDVTDPENDKVFTWEELDKKSPAEIYVKNHNYIFVPRPKKGQTLREAYTPTKGLGPSLTIENPENERWVALQVRRKENGMVALFSRLFFDPDYVVATSPATDYLPDPDIVAMEYDKVVDIFRRYFRIVSPEEYGIQIPIPMPIVPERN